MEALYHALLQGKQSRAHETLLQRARDEVEDLWPRSSPADLLRMSVAFQGLERIREDAVLASTGLLPWEALEIQAEVLRRVQGEDSGFDGSMLFDGVNQGFWIDRGFSGRAAVPFGELLDALTLDMGGFTANQARILSKTVARGGGGGAGGRLRPADPVRDGGGVVLVWDWAVFVSPFEDYVDAVETLFSRTPIVTPSRRVPRMPPIRSTRSVIHKPDDKGMKSGKKVPHRSVVPPSPLSKAMQSWEADGGSPGGWR